MQMTKKTQSIFRDNSIRDFNAALQRWVKPFDKAVEFLYYGSYFYDIYGIPYSNSNIDDGVYQSKQVRKVINSALSGMKISITECIQKRYLKNEEKILHLFLDSGFEKFENIPINTFKFNEKQVAKQSPSNFNLSVLIADGIGEESSQYAEINSSFKKHFQLISLTNSHIYFFPTVLELINNTINIVNVTTIICKNELSEDSMNYIQAGLTYCSDGLIKDTVQFLNNKALYESIKSAKAAIMSRNMSHNIGSHVMSYLKQQLSSATSISEGQVLANLIPDNVKYNSDQLEKIGLPFLVGLGRFIGYLQERQDYIASISTDHIPYGVPVNFKDAIYDELNPDLRYLRHKNDSDTKAKSRPANILLNYIAKSEGLSRENMDNEFHSEKDIRFGFINYDNQKRNYNTFGLDLTDVKNTDFFTSNNEALTQMRKINFSLPGGLVGRQAVFSIIENLIRNAAKHGDTSSVKNLDFTLDIIDGSKIRKEKDHKGVVGDWDEGKRVYEKVWRELYEKADDLDDIYLLTITDNLPCTDKTVNDLKNALYEDYVDSNTGQVTTSNKGLKEIRISAAWIRGETDESCYLKYPFSKDNNNEIDEESLGIDSFNFEKKKAPLVAVEMSAKDGHLRYIICIPKNKTVAVVSEVKKDDGTLVASFDKELLGKFYELHEQNKDRWTILTDEELKYSKTSYSFILCPDDAEAFKTLRPFTSNRLCRWIVNDESNKALSASDKDYITLLYIYRLFTGISDESECIFIADDRAKTADADREKASGKRHFDKIRFDSIDDADVNHKYLYCTHYSTKKQFTEFYVDNIAKGKSYDCIESITGDNSSDRLIRREVLDKIWYYTHLYSLQKKVAIIDERIFKSVHCIDENRFVGDKTISMMDLKQYSSQISIKDLKKKIRPLLNREGKEALINAKTFDEIAQIVEQIPRRFVRKILSEEGVYEDKTVLGNSHLTPYYHGKAVDVYTVVKNAEGKMALAGCLNEDTIFDGEKNDFCNVFKILATFEPDTKGGYELKPVSDEYNILFADRYDYISIHQGVLDKIYDNLGIKKNETAMCQLTECIYKKLMIDKSTCGKYLPRFIIHSGRAKPPKIDMPQEQPFVQYAAIENAVKDCKSILVELLDFARYEPANS